MRTLTRVVSGTVAAAALLAVPALADTNGDSDAAVAKKVAAAAALEFSTMPVSVQQAAGSNAVVIQGAVEEFRTQLGDLNPNLPGSVGSGRREVNWDGVPAQFAAPNAFPGNFFNVNSPRGVVFTTPDGSSLQVSARVDEGPIQFDNLLAGYSSQFEVFSPQRLFAAVGGRRVDTHFFVPGTNVPATTNGFGAVFSDVDLAAETRIDFFGVDGTLLARFAAPPSPGSETFSFLGVRFDAPVIARVRVVSGRTPVGAPEFPGRDVVVMDDFIYGEPIALTP